MSNTPETWYTKRATLPSLAGPPENPRRVLIECSDLALNHADNCVAVVAIMGFDTAEEAADEIAALRERVRVLEVACERSRFQFDYMTKWFDTHGDPYPNAGSECATRREELHAALTPPATTKEPANG